MSGTTRLMLIGSAPAETIRAQPIRQSASRLERRTSLLVVADSCACSFLASTPPPASSPNLRYAFFAMKRSEIIPTRTLPDLPEKAEPLSAVSIDSLLGGSVLEDSRAEAIDLSGRKLQELKLRSSVLERISFAQCEIQSLQLRDVRLVKCDLSNTVLLGFEARRVEFLECRLTGMKAFECKWQDVLVEHCDARYAQFNSGVLRACEFQATQLQDADFRAADLRGAIFTRTMLNRADFTGAKLRKADFRGADIEGIVVRAEDVAGAVVTPAQAIELSRLLGLVIK